MKIEFKNTYTGLPDRFFQRVNPANFESPKLICFNHALAKDLGIESEGIEAEKLAAIFSGQEILVGSEPIAMAYAGFQFAHPVAQLGDGRAHLLGEINGYDIQLKGSGQTPFSRQGDGRSALGPVLREYVVSEAMHVLGIPTTRALCAVTTGEQVYRQFGPEPGGVFTRVAESHLRVGTFQYFAFREDKKALQILLDYTISRHYPELKEANSYKEKSLGLLKALTVRQAELVASWSAIGFIHGVMNTDNFSVAGITIDYGPCAFMDVFENDKVFSSIDKRGRYAYCNQQSIAQWNILRLADCLLPLIDENQNKAIAEVEQIMAQEFPLFAYKKGQKLAQKLGIRDFGNADQELINLFLEYLEKESLDFTLSFRNLPKLYRGDKTGYPQTSELEAFVNQWKERVANVDHLDEINPLYIPRNHQIEKVIDRAYEDDHSYFANMLEVLSHPFHYNEKLDFFKTPPTQSECVKQTFCGT